MSHGSAVAFVLVGTRSPGNLGAVCRVAKAFGFPDVRIVRPEGDPEHDEARWLAHGAEDVLTRARATLWPDLPTAVAGCHRTAATTARPRNWGRPVLLPREGAEALRTRRESAGGDALGPYAIVFGPEDRGLTNEELAACDEILSIPLPHDPGATLSLPQAATIVAWELSRELGAAAARPAARSERSERGARPLDTAAIDRLVDGMHRALDEIGFRPRPSAVRFRGNLRDFVARARPTRGDEVVLRGIFAQVGKWRRRLAGEQRRTGGRASGRPDDRAGG